METVISYHILPNGLRIVHRPCAGAVEYCGLTVDAGSRDEAADRHGLAHFVEHTIFKGTDKRKSWHIINRMEAVGGELNAFTTKEETTLYSVFPAGNLDRAVELQADLVSRSRFPQAEIDREREVVADEINSYLDTPSEAVFDDFDDLIYAGSALGHNILGTVEAIDRLTPEVCREYLSALYVPYNMVFFYMGPASPDTVTRIAERRLGQLDHPMPPRTRTTPPVLPPFHQRRAIDSHQAHTVVGTRIPGIHDDKRHVTALLTNIVGGPGMNSLLNVALRERRGLVYTVDASTTLYSDCGTFTIYFGCDPADTDRCLRIIKGEIDRLADKGLSPRALAAAKKQYLGQLTVGADNREQLALSTARATLYNGRAMTPGEIAGRIAAVTTDDIREAAAMVAMDRCSTLTFSN
ncbi:MAG: insulinase family protein [Pseudoflavonifractor sp.]|nr:insulinase family protein [Pseudoflavonifractor sp.]